MFILSENNQSVDLNLIPEQVELNYWVFQNAVRDEDADYFCNPLLMLESFFAATVRLRFTFKEARQSQVLYLNVPADHQLLIGESTCGDLEINPVTSLSGRGFRAFSMNPLSSFTPDYLAVDVDDIYQPTKWFVPKTQPGQLLCVPLTEGYRPRCIYLVRDIPKSLEIVHTTNAW
jgi:hypothetical protein